MGYTLQIGLKKVPTTVLKRLLQQIHRGSIEFPITPLSLALLGMQDYSEALLGALRGLDQAGTRAVVIAVLAERA